MLKGSGCLRSSSSNLYFAWVIPSIQTVLLSIGALELKNLQYIRLKTYYNLFTKCKVHLQICNYTKIQS